MNVLNMVLLLPPAPAARVLEGRAFATLASRSAAAFLLIAVAGPPGGFGEAGRAVVEPVEGGELTGEEGRGEDYSDISLQCPQYHALHTPPQSTRVLQTGWDASAGALRRGRVRALTIFACLPLVHPVFSRRFAPQAELYCSRVRQAVLGLAKGAS
jgi:hypothetical protein